MVARAHRLSLLLADPTCRQSPRVSERSIPPMIHPEALRSLARRLWPGGAPRHLTHHRCIVASLKKHLFMPDLMRAHGQHRGPYGTTMVPAPATVGAGCLEPRTRLFTIATHPHRHQRCRQRRRQQEGCREAQVFQGHRPRRAGLQWLLRPCPPGRSMMHHIDSAHTPCMTMRP